MTSDDLFSTVFSRERVLAGGAPNRRAQAILFHIESRSAQHAAQLRQATERFPTEKVVQQRALAFVDAFNLGRAPPLTPTIQDIEKFASRWIDLIPQRNDIQAAIAHQLSRKYQFAAAAVPGIQVAL